MGRKQHEWITAFETAMLGINNTYIGMIHWPTAKQYYNAGYAPDKAAELYAKLGQMYANGGEHG